MKIIVNQSLNSTNSNSGSYSGNCSSGSDSINESSATVGQQ